MCINRFNCNGRFHEAVIYNGTLYLSGKVDDTGSTVAEQTKACLNKLADALEAYGSSKERILSATVYLANMNSFEEFNAAWEAWFKDGTQPVRTCVGAQLAAPQYSIEIALIAAVQEQVNADSKK